MITSGFNCSHTYFSIDSFLLLYPRQLFVKTRIVVIHDNPAGWLDGHTGSLPWLGPSSSPALWMDSEPPTPSCISGFSDLRHLDLLTPFLFLFFLLLLLLLLLSCPPPCPSPPRTGEREATLLTGLCPAPPVRRGRTHSGLLAASSLASSWDVGCSSACAGSGLSSCSVVS